MFEFGTDGPSLILVGIDGSETSMRAGAYAAGLARRQRTRLVCLFVHTSSSLAGNVPAAAAAVAGANVEIAAQLREQVETQSASVGVDAVFVERHGNPYVEIRRAAAELRADAVIIGASTQAGHRIIGSLAAHLVRDAEWPITVVP